MNRPNSRILHTIVDNIKLFIQMMRRKQNVTVVLVMNLVCNHFSLKEQFEAGQTNVSLNLATLFQKLMKTFL